MDGVEHIKKYFFVSYKKLLDITDEKLCDFITSVTSAQIYCIFKEKHRRMKHIKQVCERL
jgi:hypothetical protein